MNKIQIRRGTTSEWAAANPVLASGEPGLDTTTGDFKIGDGITAWLSLPLEYAPLSLVATVASLTTTVTPTAWTAFSYATGWAAYGGYEVPGYRKVGDIVSLRGLISASAGVTATLATLPVGYRPPTSTLLTSCYSARAAPMIRIDITTNGVIAITGPVVGEWYAMSSVPPFSVTA